MHLSSCARFYINTKCVKILFYKSDEVASVVEASMALRSWMGLADLSLAQLLGQALFTQRHFPS